MKCQRPSEINMIGYRSGRGSDDGLIVPRYPRSLFESVIKSMLMRFDPLSESFSVDREHGWWGELINTYELQSEHSESLLMSTSMSEISSLDYHCLLSLPSISSSTPEMPLQSGSPIGCYLSTQNAYLRHLRFSIPLIR